MELTLDMILSVVNMLMGLFRKLIDGGFLEGMF